MTTVRTLLLGAALLALPVAVAAQGTDLGAHEFANSCAGCHGADGTGGGIIAGYLTETPPDLTMLARENGGVLPIADLYAIIDGSAASGVHGSSDMPAWGSRYAARAPHMLGEMYSPADRDAFVQARILALVEYISTLQAE